MRPDRSPKNHQHRFRATCGTCGDVELGSDQLEVEVRTADGGGVYAFDCPSCRRSVVHAAAPKVVELLLSTGVAARWLPFGDGPARDGGSQGSVGALSPISEDEVADFAARRGGDDSWLDELLG